MNGQPSTATRREFLATTTAAAAFAALPRADAATPRILSVPPPIIDTNVCLGRWPFRHLELDEPAALVSRLRGKGVTQAWAGSFEALLHKDISSVNTRLAENCRKHGRNLLVPVGALNPMLPGWEEDLRRCHEVHKMPGIRLHPNYHGYKLDSPTFAQVLDSAARRGLLVQIAVIMEEERTIHPLVNVPPTDTAPLPSLLKKFPRLRLQLLNAFRTLRGKPVLDLAANGAHFEIAMLEGVNGVGNLLAQIPQTRLCFGSHAPFFYFESALLKLQESALKQDQVLALCTGNSKSLLSA